MAVLDEPDTLDTDDVPTVPNEDDDGSKGSNVEILDGGSDADIYEGTELIKFSRMLCDAQKKALAEEKVKGNKRTTYNGHSRTTAHRWKRYRSDLAAQGYLPVHEFMKRMEAQKKKDELTASQELTVEESEESSDDDAVTGSNEPSMSEGMDIVELAPAAAVLQVGIAAESHRACLRRGMPPPIAIAPSRPPHPSRGLLPEYSIP
jgi:hypothetical protein